MHCENYEARCAQLCHKQATNRTTNTKYFTNSMRSMKGTKKIKNVTYVGFLRPTLLFKSACGVTLNIFQQRFLLAAFVLNNDERNRNAFWIVLRQTLHGWPVHAEIVPRQCRDAVEQRLKCADATTAANFRARFFVFVQHRNTAGAAQEPCTIFGNRSWSCSYYTKKH